MTLDPDCVSVRIDKSTASANRSPKIMLVVRSELNSAMWTQMKSRAWQTCWVTVWLTSLSSTFWAYLLLSCSVSQSLPPSLAFILKKTKTRRILRGRNLLWASKEQNSHLKLCGFPQGTLSQYENWCCKGDLKNQRTNKTY